MAEDLPFHLWLSRIAKILSKFCIDKFEDFLPPTSHRCPVQTIAP